MANSSGMMRGLARAAALALCVTLSACFVSEKPLFVPEKGAAVFGKGLIKVESRTGEDEPDTDALRWTPAGYIDPADADADATSFHRAWGWFSPWYIAQSGGKDGYIYNLYRKDGARLLDYNVSCKDLTPQEASNAHLVRNASGEECTATRAEDLLAGFHLLAQRKHPKGYLTVAGK